MEDMFGEPCGPQLYVLSEEGYEELKAIQIMLSLMADIVYNKEDDPDGDTKLIIRRAQIHYFFQEISEQIGAALERIGKENSVGSRGHLWQ